MKFAVVGDVHIADVPPSTRKDDYRNVVLGKLRFIINSVNADGQYSAVLFVGDLFHKKIPFHNSHSMLSSLISIFESCKVPIYIIPGNHDIHGNMSTFENQPMNVLVQAGVVTLLDGKTPVLFDSGDETVSLNGVPFSPLMDSKDSASLYNLEHLDADVKVSMFHQMILPDDKKFFLDYINFVDLANINADVVICGHYHEGYNPALSYAHGKYFLNGGSITRGTAEQANFDKIPKFVTLVIARDGGVIPTVKAFETEIPYVASEEVFDFNVIERNKKKKDMHEFMEGLSEMESQSLSTQEPQGVLNALKVLGLDPRLEPLALRYLEEAHAMLV